MLFEWKLPNAAPDPAALERMKHHFPKPSAPMPVAWFMGEKIEYYTNLVEKEPDSLTEREFEQALAEISGGLVSFPGIEYESVWVEWYKFLLPYAIPLAHKYSVARLLGELLATTLTIYPTSIPDEYSGFRHDLIYSLGTRLIPQHLARDEAGGDSLRNTLFGDIWDFVDDRHPENIGLNDDFNLSMIFCLLYLNPDELRSWVASLVKIESAQWYLALMIWWLEVDRFRRLGIRVFAEGTVPIFTKRGKLFNLEYFGKQEFYRTLNRYPIKTRLDSFQAELVSYLKHSIVQEWVAEIRKHYAYRLGDTQYPFSRRKRQKIEKTMRVFEKKFFTSTKS